MSYSSTPDKLITRIKKGIARERVLKKSIDRFGIRERCHERHIKLLKEKLTTTKEALEFYKMDGDRNSEVAIQALEKTQ